MTAHAGSRLAWLALTPEPERELPEAVAILRRTMRSSAAPPEATSDTASDMSSETSSETRKVQRLVLRGTGRSWRRYLHEISELTHLVADRVAAAAPTDRADRAEVELATAALLAGEVVLEHHRMLIGLPGTGYRETEQDRKALAATVARLGAWLAGHAPQPADPAQAADPMQEGGN